LETSAQILRLVPKQTFKSSQLERLTVANTLKLPQHNNVYCRRIKWKKRKREKGFISGLLGFKLFELVRRKETESWLKYKPRSGRAKKF